MRRRPRPEDAAQPRADDRYAWNRTRAMDKSWPISPRSVGLFAVLVGLTALNALAAQRWHRRRGVNGLGVGDAVEVRLPLHALLVSSTLCASFFLSFLK